MTQRNVCSLSDLVAEAKRLTFDIAGNPADYEDLRDLVMDLAALAQPAQPLTDEMIQRGKRAVMKQIPDGVVLSYYEAECIARAVIGATQCDWMAQQVQPEMPTRDELAEWLHEKHRSIEMKERLGDYPPTNFWYISCHKNAGELLALFAKETTP